MLKFWSKYENEMLVLGIITPIILAVLSWEYNFFNWSGIYLSLSISTMNIIYITLKKEKLVNKKSIKAVLKNVLILFGVSLIITRVIYNNMEYYLNFDNLLDWGFQILVWCIAWDFYYKIKNTYQKK